MIELGSMLVNKKKFVMTFIPKEMGAYKTPMICVTRSNGKKVWSIVDATDYKSIEGKEKQIVFTEAWNRYFKKKGN